MPISLPTALLVGGGLSAAGGVASGILGSNAASNAANAQAGAADQAAQLQRQNAIDSLNFQKQVFGQQQANQAPWLSAGSGALSKLSYLLGIPGVSQLSQSALTPQTSSTNTGNGFDPNNFGSAFDNNPALNRLRGGGNSSAGGPQLMSANSATMPAGGGGSAVMPNNPSNMPSGFGNRINGISPINGGTAQLPPGGFAGGGQNFSGGPQASGTPGGIVGNNPNPDTSGIIQANGGGSAVVPFAGNDGTAATGGGFGSLLQPYGQTFQAPTNVTEQNDPGYQFRLNQGNQLLQNSAAAKGGLLSGGTAKALMDFGQNDASNEYSNVYNRALNNFQTNYNQYNNDQSTLFNRLAAISGMGQTSAGQLNSNGSQAASNVGSILLGSGQQIGNDLQNAGAARGSGYVGGANAIGGGISSGLNSLGGSLGLLALLNGGGGGSGANPGAVPSYPVA
jgi:hypothetical protein